MRCCLYRVVVVLVVIVLVPLTRASASDPSRLWTELSDSGHVAKIQSLPDFVDLAAKLSPAVVNISSEETDEPAANSEEEEPGDSPGEKTPHNPFEEYSPHAKSLGSGFIISKDGYVLTNDHVVTDADHVAVSTQDGYQYKAKVVGRDEKSDIALLKIEPKHDLPVAPLGNSDDVKVGQWVMAIGNP